MCTSIVFKFHCQVVLYKEGDEKVCTVSQYHIFLQFLVEYLTPRMTKFCEQQEAVLDEDEKVLQLASALAIVHLIVKHDMWASLDNQFITPLCHALLLKPSSPTTVDSYDRLKEHYDPKMLKLVFMQLFWLL